LVVVLALGAIGSMDLLLVHGVFGGYPIAWLPAMAVAAITIYLVLTTGLLRPQGLDRGVLIEVLAFAIAATVSGMIALGGATPLPLALATGAVWTISLGVSWMVAARRPVRVAGERALEQFVGGLADVDDERI